MLGIICTYSAHLCYKYSKSHFFLLSHLILELLSNFMVMINIIKIELINADVNCPANIFSVYKSFFTNKIMLHPSASYLIQTKGLEKIWTKHYITDFES